MVPQLPGGHIAGALAGLLELLVRPMDLQLRGAGGVERAARIPVEEHVVAGIRGQRLGHGSAGHQCAGGRQARAELRSQRGATDCSLALPALGGDRGFRQVGSASNGEGAHAWPPLTDQPTLPRPNRAPIHQKQPLQHQLAILGAQLTIALPAQAGLAHAVGGGVDTGAGHDTSLGMGPVSCWFRGLWGGDCRWVGVLRWWSCTQCGALRLADRVRIKS